MRGDVGEVGGGRWEVGGENYERWMNEWCVLVVSHTCYSM